VVGIWGFGFNDSNHPWSAADCLSVVQWFKDQGCYVMGGVPTYWRTGVNDSRAGYLDVYSAFDMVSPWMVGRIGSAADSNNFSTNVNVGRVGAQGIYISMFDEYGEGNQILNTAPTQATVPTNSGLLSLDEDGTACSADYYLRLTDDGGKMLKGQIALSATRPTAPQVTGGGGGGCGTLTANQQLTPNQSTLSCDGRFTLILQGDGNLVLYQGGTPLWASNAVGKASARAILQGDGNLVIYDSAGSPLWASNTAGNDGAHLTVQNDGNTVIFSSSGAALWSTGTGGH